MEDSKLNLSQLLVNSSVCLYRKSCIETEFENIVRMEQFYQQQALLPHFTVQTRQRGSVFESLAAGVGWAVLPLAEKNASCNQINRQEIVCSKIAELVEVSKKKFIKQAAESALQKTVEKQLVGRTKANLRVIKRKNYSGKLFSDFFQESKTLPTVFCMESSHSLLNWFERPPIVILVDTSIQRIIGPNYAPTFKFEVLRDHTNFIKLLSFFLEVKSKKSKPDGTDLDLLLQLLQTAIDFYLRVLSS